MYWQDDNGKVIGNIERLLYTLGDEGEHIEMAMNGGMYLEDRSPQGLYIEDGITIKPTNMKKHAYGNFYMQPNGVFTSQPSLQDRTRLKKNYNEKKFSEGKGDRHFTDEWLGDGK